MYTTPGIKKKSFGKSSSRFSSMNYSTSRRSSFKKPRWSGFKSSRGASKLLGIASVVIGIPLIIGVVWFYSNVIRDLPQLDDLKEMKGIAQASVVTDRNGKELYRIFAENRQYITIDKVAPILQDAIVATEDQTFWDNPGIDPIGIVKVGIQCFINRNKCRGASTITQQLIKNLYLNDEKSIAIRKMKEIILSFKLKSVLEQEIRTTLPGIGGAQLKEEVKKKVLEVYLNYISLGNNSYGVESASMNYFGTSAQYLDVLESAILAGLPQAPGRYNVYTNRGVVMGYLHVIDKSSGDEAELDDQGRTELHLRVASLVNEKDIRGSDGDAFINYLRQTLNFDYTYGANVYTVQYKLGRKDEVLARMYDTKVITAQEAKDAIIEGMTYEFKKAAITLTAPHFVFWIKELLESPDNKYLGTFDHDILYKGGLTIKTSLDLDIQKMAEKAVKDNITGVRAYGAHNTALLHMDSVRGDILAYVGSADFNNLDIKGQNDMIRAPIQPGSTIKPLFYALGFMKLPLTLDTQMFDIKFKVGDYDPQNADGVFNGPMSLKKALAYSRNIPAIKMYFAVGQQAEFIKFAQQMGVQSLKNEINYGPSLGIGAGEMQMLELGNMYAHLSAQGKPAKIDPIVEITAADGTIIYKRSTEQQTQVIPSGVAYLIWNILSDFSNLPSDWVSRFRFNGITFAHKTGTSNIRTADGTRRPKDGWLATYTPSKVTLFWAGNTTPRALNANAYGGWINNSTWRQFWTDLKNGGYLTDELVPETEVKRVTIAKNSGKLATDTTPESNRISTLAYIKTAPTTYDADTKQIQIDSLCYGKVSDLTPPEDIIAGYIATVASFMPNNMDLPDIMTYMGTNQGALGSSGVQSYTFFVNEPQQECSERQAMIPDNSTGDTEGEPGGWDTGIGSKLTVIRPTPNASVTNNFSLWYTATTRPPATIVVSINGNTIAEYTYTTNIINDTKNITIPGAQPNTTHTIDITLTDALGVPTKHSINVKIQANDTRPPYIVRPNTVVTPSQGKYSVTLVFADLESSVKGGTITQGNTQVSSFEGAIATFTVNDLSPLSFSVRDYYDNIGQGTIEISQYVQ